MNAPDVDLKDYGLLDPAVQQCPHEYYARMRSDSPVFKTSIGPMPIYLVTTYDLILKVVNDPATFSSNFGNTALPPSSDLARRLKEQRDELGGYAQVGTMLTIDPPAQTRYRKLVSKAFTPRAVAELEPVVRDITAALIDGFVDKGTIEFVSEFAVPLPVRVIAKALNVPDDRLDDFKRWSDDSIAGIGTALTDDQQVMHQRGIIEFQLYFADQLEQRRVHPQNDILTNLLNARIDASEDPDLPDVPLTMPEMLSILQQLLVAGNETTTKMLTEMMRLLAENPVEWDRVRNNPTTAKGVVEETLRMSTPTQGMWRIATKDTEVGGVEIPAGSRLVIMFTSGNRDQAMYENPDGFCPGRANAMNHLAFGRGIHYCVGAGLSRLEGLVAMEELARRLSSISLPASNTFEYHPSFMLRGLKRLDLAIAPA